MVTARSDHTATLLDDGRVLVVGGHDRAATTAADDAPVQLASAELFDPVAGTWTLTGTLAAPRFGHSATLLPDGQVLVVGGYDFEAAMAIGVEIAARTTAELYDPETGQWVSTGSMTIGRGGHSATLLPDGRVLVAGGGVADADIARSAEVYDPATRTWSTAASMIDGRFGHAASMLPDGRVFVVGGRTIGSEPEPYASAEILDPAAGVWTAAGSLPGANRACSATALDDGGGVLVLGVDADQNAIAARYDPGSGTWTDAGSPAVGTPVCSAAQLGNGDVLGIGVAVEDAPAGAGLFDPRTLKWSATSSLIRARAGAAVVSLRDGTVLVTGGDVHPIPAGNSMVGSAERFGAHP